VFDFSLFLHGSKTVGLVMIMIGFRCLGSSCLDLGLASAPDCLASVSTSLLLPDKNALTTTLDASDADDDEQHQQQQQPT